MNPSVNISRYQRLDGTVLKLIACLSMFIDILGAVCFSRDDGFQHYRTISLSNLLFFACEGGCATRNMRNIFCVWVFLH